MFCVANTTTIVNPKGNAVISMYLTFKNTANSTLECHTQSKKTKHTFRNPRAGMFVTIFVQRSKPSVERPSVARAPQNTVLLEQTCFGIFMDLHNLGFFNA